MSDGKGKAARPTRLKSERVQGAEPRPARLKSERVQGNEPRPTRLKSERVQGTARAAGGVEAKLHEGESGAPAEAEFRFSRPALALQFASLAALGAFFFGLDPRLHCGDGRVRVWFPAGARATALDLGAKGPVAFLRTLEVIAQEMERAGRPGARS
jgi:hypothetical protein